MTRGSALLTGGRTGAEASLIVFPVMAIVFVAFHFRFRAVNYPVDGRRGLPS